MFVILCFFLVRGPPVPPKSAQLRRSYNSSASSTDQLQAKLRKLLNADSKENLIEVRWITSLSISYSRKIYLSAIVLFLVNLNPGDLFPIFLNVI